MKVSYCTTCRNRAHHLKITLPSNLHHAHPGDEFVVVDYGSEDRLGDWIRREYCAELRVGLLLYARVEEMSEFIPPHAKNIAHRLGSGEVLCNLDADNCVGDGFGDWLRQMFAAHESAVTGAESHGVGGGFGRIAMRREDFLRLGGYDERMRGWGYEDDDLVLRARAFGLHKLVTPPRLLHWLQHADDQRCIRDGGKGANRDGNKRLSDVALAERRLVANEGKPWGAAKMQINFCEERTL